MSKDYTGTLLDLAPGAATPEITINDNKNRIEAALTEISAQTGTGGGDTGDGGSSGLPPPGTVGQFLGLVAPTTGTEPVPAWVDAPTGGDTGGTEPGGGYGSRFAPPKAADFATEYHNTNVALTAVDDADVGLSLSIPSQTGDKVAGIFKNVPASGNWTVIFKIVSNSVGGNYNAQGLAITGPNVDHVGIFGYDLPQTVVGLNQNSYNKSGNFKGVNFSAISLVQPQWFKLYYDDANKAYNFFFSKDGKNWTYLGRTYETTYGGKITQVGFGFGCNYAVTDYRFSFSVPYWQQDWT